MLSTPKFDLISLASELDFNNVCYKSAKRNSRGFIHPLLAEKLLFVHLQREKKKISEMCKIYEKRRE